MNNTKKGRNLLITDALKMWAAWQERYRLKLGYPAKSIGISSGGINCWDDLSDNVDGWICGEVDAAIVDLGRAHPSQAAAVNHCYSASVFRFPRHNYPQLLENGIEWLARELKRRGLQIDEISIDTIKEMR